MQFLMLLVFFISIGNVFSQSDNASLQKSEIGNIPNQEVVAQKVRNLLRQLDADLLVDRDAAEKQLIELGVRALDLLPKVNDSTGAELRVRLQRIRDQLGNAALKKSIVPSTVTLVGEYTVEDALHKITEQTQNKFTLESPPIKTLTLNLSEVPFWKAVDTVLDQSGLDVNAFSTSSGTIMLQAKSPTASPRLERGSYAGIFRIEPTSVQATRSLRSEDQNSMRLVVSLAWEPRLHPAYFQFPMKSVSGELTSGESIGPASANATPEYSPNAGPQMEVELLIALPPRSEKKLAKLKGQFMAAVPSERVQIEFDKLDKAGRKSQQIGDLTVTLERVRKNQAIYEVVALIRFVNAGQTMDSFRGWIMNNEAYLKDSDGHRVENVGSNTYRMTGDEVGINYLFDMSKGAEKYRFIYEAPGSVSLETVSFELTEIPLP